VITAINSMSEELSNREEQINPVQEAGLARHPDRRGGHEITNPLNNISMIAQTYEEMYDHLPDRNGASS